jgi:hypothetical protein
MVVAHSVGIGSFFPLKTYAGALIETFLEKRNDFGPA